MVIEFIVITFSILVILVFSLWLAIALALDDFSIPTVTLPSFKNLLVIYPHPDDETLTSGGLTQMLVGSGAKATLHILTMGEKGTFDASTNTNLKDIRAKELQRSANILQFTTVIHDDLGDGQLQNKKAKVKQRIEAVMRRVKPDLVVTYDQSGLYGHPDHIVVSEVVTPLIQTSFPKTALWYFSVPPVVFQLLKMPIHMAKDKNVLQRRTVPTHKIWIGANIINKIRALYQHQSQLRGFKNGLPSPLLPLWFVHSTRLFEYYFDTSPRKTT